MLLIKNLYKLAVCIIFMIFISAGCTKEKKSLSDELFYFGQKLPGKTPELFAPGIISTDKDEINSVFSPDGTEFYFSRDTYKNISKAGRDYTIYYMRTVNGIWTKPEQVSFAGVYMCADMCFSSDGKMMFYCTDRPANKNGPRKEDSDIWFVKRTISGWSEPKNPGPLFNSPKNEWYPTMSDKGMIYFSSGREGGNGGSDIYRIKLENFKTGTPENIGGPVNTKFRESDVLITPDESCLIFSSSDRPDVLGSGDLYISFAKKDGSWTKPVNMGEGINSPQLEYCPMISPDGKYFFFTSRRSGNDDVYWVDARIFGDLRPAGME